MEIENTPNENLTKNEDSIEKNKKFNAQAYFLNSENNNTQTDQSPITIVDQNRRCGLACLFLLFVALFASIMILSDYKSNHKKLIYIFIGIIFLILFILILTKCKKKIVFSKNTQKNKFYIKRYNFLNIPILDLELSLGNYNIEIERVVFSSKNGGGRTYHEIYLYNQFNDTSEINLDTTNIKNVPIKLIYTFNISISDYNDAKNILENKLNNFICSKNFKDQENKFPSYTKINDFKYSDYFFTFIFHHISNNHFLSIKGVIRIDFIYSKNFDIIFIGVVKKGEKSYAKTFEFKMDNIDKFILQNFQDNTGFYLKVIFKDQQIEDIWPIENKNQDDLEGLILFLNERLIN